MEVSVRGFVTVPVITFWDSVTPLCSTWNSQQIVETAARNG